MGPVFVVVAIFVYSGCVASLRLQGPELLEPAKCSTKMLARDPGNNQPLLIRLQGSSRPLQGSSWLKTATHELGVLEDPGILSNLKVYVPDTAFLQDHRRDAFAMDPNHGGTQFFADIAVHEVLLGSANRVGTISEADLVFVPWYSRFLMKCGTAVLAESLNYLKRVIEDAGNKRIFVIYSSTRLPGELLRKHDQFFAKTELFHFFAALLYKPNVHVGAIEMNDHRRFRFRPNKAKDFAVPYFIPSKFATESLLWSKTLTDKTYFVHFRGSDTSDERKKIRSAFVNDKFVNFNRDLSENRSSPAEEMQLMQDAIFCIVPSGITSTTRRLFESILNGCIPVLVNEFVRGADTLVPFRHVVKAEEFMVVWDGRESYEALAQRVYSMSPKEMLDKWTKLNRFKFVFLYELPGVFHGPGAVDAILSNLEMIVHNVTASM